MKGVYAVLWREYIYFIRRYKSITFGSIVSPLLYLITFGYGLGESVKMDGIHYIDFLIPGLVAISSMNTAFNSIATPLTLARLSDKTLEEYICSPVSNISFVLGKVFAGALRGLYSALLILFVSYLFGATIKLSILFFILLLLNCLIFSNIGLFMSLVIKSHMDMARFRNFVMTPMVFICGTFFSLENIPDYISKIIKILPLTPASYGLRAMALGWEYPIWSLVVQFVYFTVFMGLGYYFYSRLE